MNEIKIFKDEKFRETSQAEEFQKFGELCYLLAGAVCAENKEDAWKLIHDAAKIGGAAGSTAFDELYRVVVDEIYRKHKKKNSFIESIRRTMGGCKHE